MQPLAPSDRMLARHLLTADGIYDMVVASTNPDGTVVFEPFVAETSGTIWTNSDAALLRSGVLTEFLLDDLERMVSLRIPLPRIYSYLQSSSLLAHSGTAATILPLN